MVRTPQRKISIFVIIANRDLSRLPIKVAGFDIWGKIDFGVGGRILAEPCSFPSAGEISEGNLAWLSGSGFRGSKIVVIINHIPSH